MKRAIVSLIFIFMICLPLVLTFLPVRVEGAINATLIKFSNKTTVGQGETLTYNITVRNLGPENRALHVWVNDTLPSQVTYVNDTAYTLSSIFNYSILNGQTLELKFWNVQKNIDYNFTITTTVDAAVSDGEILYNTAIMDYTNGLGVNQPPVTAYWNVTVSMPSFEISKTVTYDTIDPSLITYQINVSNKGSVGSLRMWLNDSIPDGMNFISFQGNASCTPQPRSLNCTRDNFPPGTELWNITMRMTSAVPTETTIVNWIFLNYTTQYGSMMPGQSTNAYFIAPTAIINLSKTADQNFVTPGTNMHYYINYDNTGAMNASSIWINDTLPTTGVTIVSASPTPVENVTGRIKWYFTDVNPGVHIIDIEVSIASSLLNGTILSNQVSADYYDVIGRKRPTLTSIANTTVLVDIPNIRVVKTANVKTIHPGGQILYAIYYNNTGNVPAGRVTIDDEIPVGTQLLAANPSYTTRSGYHYFWDFQDVSPGIHSISITLMVESGVSIGSDLPNRVTVTYFDSFGRQVGSNFNSVIVGVRSPGPPPNGEGGLPTWLAAALVVAMVAIILAGFLYIKRGRATYIDDVFLLHRDGLLIKHFTRRLNPDVDSDILGGMLIAVQNFVNESFASDRGLAKEGGLDELKFGKYSVMLTRGKSIVLAAVISGVATSEVSKKIRSVVERIEKAYGRVLEKWSGDMAQVTGVERYLKDLTSTKYQEKVKKKKPAS